MEFERAVELKELLTPEEIAKVSEYLERKDFKGLKEFLKKREKKLKEKGVLPEYLTYYLEYLTYKKLGEIR